MLLRDSFYFQVNHSQIEQRLTPMKNPIVDDRHHTNATCARKFLWRNFYWRVISASMENENSNAMCVMRDSSPNWPCNFIWRHTLARNHSSANNAISDSLTQPSWLRIWNITRQWNDTSAKAAATVLWLIPHSTNIAIPGKTLAPWCRFSPPWNLLLIHTIKIPSSIVMDGENIRIS